MESDGDSELLTSGEFSVGGHGIWLCVASCYGRHGTKLNVLYCTIIQKADSNSSEKEESYYDEDENNDSEDNLTLKTSHGFLFCSRLLNWQSCLFWVLSNSPAGYSQTYLSFTTTDHSQLGQCIVVNTNCYLSKAI